MVKEFFEDEYDFKLKPEMRTFAAVVVPIACGNLHAAKAGRAENVNWARLIRSTIPTKTLELRLWRSRCRR
jgi:hypothetical protein